MKREPAKLSKTWSLPSRNLRSNYGEKLRAIMEECDTCHKRDTVLWHG